MKNQVLYAIAVVFYISMVAALVTVLMCFSDDTTRMLSMNVISTALMTGSLIIALFFMKNREKQRVYDEFEELSKKDQER